MTQGAEDRLQHTFDRAAVDLILNAVAHLLVGILKGRGVTGIFADPGVVILPGNSQQRGGFGLVAVAGDVGGKEGDLFRVRYPCDVRWLSLGDGYGNGLFRGWARR